jgi:hypothetical protein
MTGIPGVLRRGIIQPRYILAIVIVLIAMMVSMALYEFSPSRKDIMRILQEEAISIMSDNALVCFSKIGILGCIDVATVMEERAAAGKVELGEAEGNEKAMCFADIDHHGELARAYS